MADQDDLVRSLSLSAQCRLPRLILQLTPLVSGITKAKEQWSGCKIPHR